MNNDKEKYESPIYYMSRIIILTEKLNTKQCILYDFIYIKPNRQPKYGGVSHICGCCRREGNFWSDGNVLYLV